MIEAVRSLQDFELDGRSVVTIGKFDGIHRGHQKLIEETVKKAREMSTEGEKVKAVVLAFEMTPQMLLTRKERRKMLEKMGVDVIVECSFGPRLIRTTAEDFIREILVGKLHAVHVVVGKTFRFGYERRGDDALLSKMGEELGFTVDPVSELLDGRFKISSSTIRKELMRGNMERVNDLLGYTYSVTGKIIHGREVGRTIGVPTANIKPGKHKLLPPNGVYMSETDIDGTTYYGITDIGTKPTVDGQFVGVETYYFNFKGDIYGKKLTVRLLHFSRPEIKFDSLEDLKRQLTRDAEDGKAYFKLS